MNKNNSEVIGNFTNFHIFNINKYLKEAKLNAITEFIWVENNRIIITINKISSAQNMSIIEKYLKENKNINSDYINSPCLLKFKLYLKILSLLYTLDNTNLPITSEIIKEVIKKSHIFNDVILVSCYELKSLELNKRTNSCIRVTQENSIENSIQDYLSYIQIPNSLCKLFLAYPKWPCIHHMFHMWYNIIFPECSISFCCISWLVTITVTKPSGVTGVCDSITDYHSNSNPRV